MLKRLQVLLPEDELREIRAVARRQRLTTAEWVRRTLRESVARAPGPDATSKLRAIRAAMVHQYPVDDIGVMLDEIERGYLKTDADPHDG